MVGKGPYGVYVTKFHWLLDPLCLRVDQGPFGVYVTKFHWLLDPLCLMVDQGPYGVYVTRPLWSVRYEVSLVVGHPVSDENSACWIPMRHETLSGGDVKLYLLPRQLI